MRGYVVILFVLFFCMGKIAAKASQATVDSGGGPHSNAFFTGVGAVGQGTPVGHTSSPQHDNYSGFLNTWVARPDLDNDNDGIADENDTDDDNDGLSDMAELNGTGFSPNTPTDLFNADSDQDGTGDGEESIAGTNPQDSDSQLAIVWTTREPGGDVIEWQSRSNKTYRLLQAGNVGELSISPTTAAVITARGIGLGPFEETTTLYTNPASGTVSFYGIEVLP